MSPTNVLPPRAAVPILKVAFPPPDKTADVITSPSSSCTSRVLPTLVSEAVKACALESSVAVLSPATITFLGAVIRVVRPAVELVIEPPTALRVTSRCDVTVPSMKRLLVLAVSVTSVFAPTVAMPPVTLRSGAVKAIDPSTVVAPSTVRLESDV